jgi:predicted transcriptional regulator
VTVSPAAHGADGASGALCADVAADVAAAAVVAYRAALEEAEAILTPARAARADAVWALTQAGWSVRRVARELDMSPALVGQLTARARAGAWETLEDLPRINERADSLDAFRVARHAQDVREESFTGGNATERAAFYGRKNAPAMDGTEDALTWKAWLRGSRAEQPA